MYIYTYVDVLLFAKNHHHKEKPILIMVTLHGNGSQQIGSRGRNGRKRLPSGICKLLLSFQPCFT